MPENTANRRFDLGSAWCAEFCGWWFFVQAGTPSFPLPKRLSSSRGVSYRLSFVVVGLSISILKI